MVTDKLKLFILAVITLIATHFSASAVTVYFDNSSTRWVAPHVHYWIPGGVTTTWPGEAMTLKSGDIWEHDIPADKATMVIFNNNNQGSKTGDLKLVADHVYTQQGDSGKTYDEYIAGGGGEEDPDDIDDDIYVFADVPGWTGSTVHAYIYKGVTPYVAWPGEDMTKDPATGYWYYAVPKGYRSTGKVIFFQDATNRHPGDDMAGLDINGRNMIYHAEGNVWEEYSGEIPDPGEMVDYTIYFHNNVTWPNVYVNISGNISGQSNGGKMESFLNSSIHEFSFKAPENASLHCSFYHLDGSQHADQTSSFTVVNNHVYTVSGDKGDYSTYDPSQAEVEAEYWIDPASPTQRDKATLWFNRAYTSDSKLRDTDDIYLWTWLVDNKDKHINGPTGAWETPSEKYKMTRSSENPDLFYMEFAPSIDAWFGVTDPDVRVTQIGFIFRDQSGSTTQHAADLTLPLRQLPDPSAGMGAYISHEINDGTVEITAEKGKLYVTPLDKEIVKVFTLRSGASVREERESISVPAAGSAAYVLETPEFSTSLSDSELLIDINGGVRVVVNRETCQLSFTDQNDNVYLRELNGLNNIPGNISISFDAMDEEGFYGGGYNGNYINQDGKTMTMCNTQRGGWGQGTQPPHNICIPFYVSTRGYGVYIDDHYRNAKVFPSSNGTTYSSGSQNPVAYYFIGGGEFDGAYASMETVVQNYTRLTGLQELPPYWSLGYITSKFSFETRTEAEATINNTKNINIPIDGIVFDIHWQGGVSKMGKIDWDTSRYNNPQEMMSNFLDKNVHTIAITEPFFTSNCGNYQTLKDNGWLADNHVENMAWLESSDVGLLDVSNTGAKEWFKDLYKARTSEGIDSWWLDLGEPEQHDGESTYVAGDFNQMHNEYGNRWTELAYEAMKECRPDERFILMPRAGTSGMQRYNTFPWTGDILRQWSGLQAQVPALVSAAMSGVSYLGSDIGGFTSRGTNPNLYRRWVQLGVFYPSMRTHSADQPEVWQNAYSGIRNDVRDAINLRYAYLPYTYSQSYAYSRYGTPIARPANYYDHGNRSLLANCIDAYLWGPDVYVAPMLTEGTSRSITFPEGEWLDMNDFSTVYQGGSNTTYSVPTNVIPHFMRRGSFVTRYRQDTFTSTAEIETHRLTVDYFPTKDGVANRSVIFDDDHKSVSSIADGKYLVTTFEGTGSDNSVLLRINREGDGWDGMYDTQDILFRIHIPDMHDLNTDNIRLYTVGGAESAPAHKATGICKENSGWSVNDLQSASSVDDLQSSSRTTNAYYKDGSNLYVRLPNVSPTSTMAVEVGDPGIHTGVETPVNLSAMTFSYANGIFTYCAPEGTNDLAIDVVTPTGVRAARYDGLEANGYATQIRADLAPGLYIGRLSGRNTAGSEHTVSVKMIVR